MKQLSNHTDVYSANVNICWLLILSCCGVFQITARAEEKTSIVSCQASISSNDDQLQQFFAQRTQLVTEQTVEKLQQITPENWSEQKDQYRAQLANMLGLEPLPERADLQVSITGEIEQPEYIIRKMHYQSLPGLYVTANLYLPREVSTPRPAILYVCGHAQVKENGISYGNKVGYHHHGIWFAKNGYVCLTIDTIQLGEFQGHHHGTFREGWWWWNARGYTPAGVETWNGIRGIDLLQSLPEVDPEKIGVTGRSGGGAYSWYIAAMDERIKAAAPVAGITSLKNHIVDDCIEGHCDCMFMINTFQWDFPLLAALVAPRPLLIINTDKDRIFPLDGVLDVYWKTSLVYDRLNASDNLGLAISEGPHQDTQRLQVNAFEWFDRFLMQQERQAQPTEKQFTPQELKVFSQLPADERTSHIHDSFIQLPDLTLPASKTEWELLKRDWKSQLKQYCFAGWPASTPVAAPLKIQPQESDQQIAADWYQFHTEGPVHLKFQFMPANSKDDTSGKKIALLIHDGQTKIPQTTTNEQITQVYFTPRGYGINAWSGDQKEQTHIRRRFALLGYSLDAARLWDLCQLIHSLRKLPGYERAEIRLSASGELAGLALYAPLFVEDIHSLHLAQVPASHAEGPIFLNVLRILDLPQVYAMTSETCSINLSDSPAALTAYARNISALKN